MENEFLLINTLTESRVFRSKQAMEKISDTDILELFYLYVLSIYVMNKDEKTKKWVKNYAMRTRAGSYDRFKPSATDLYMMIYILSGNHVFKEKEKLHMFSTKLINTNDFTKYLYFIINDRGDESLIKRYIFKLERSLRINNSTYKSLRRKILNWDTLGEKEKKLIRDRLYMFIRTINTKAEVLDGLRKYTGNLDSLSAKQKLAVGIGIGAVGFAAGWHLANKI